MIVVGCMLALGTAMEYTGTASFIADQIIRLKGLDHPTLLLSLFFFLTMVLTQPMSNQAAAALVLPIAIQTATHLGLNPRAFAVMIAVSASCSFITPLEPACLIAYSPGHYKFLDFTKVGLTPYRDRLSHQHRACAGTLASHELSGFTHYGEHDVGAVGASPSRVCPRGYQQPRN